MCVVWCGVCVCRWWVGLGWVAVGGWRGGGGRGGGRGRDGRMAGKRRRDLSEQFCSTAEVNQVRCLAVDTVASQLFLYKLNLGSFPPRPSSGRTPLHPIVRPFLLGPPFTQVAFFPQERPYLGARSFHGPSHLGARSSDGGSFLRWGPFLQISPLGGAFFFQGLHARPTPTPTSMPTPRKATPRRATEVEKCCSLQ